MGRDLNIDEVWPRIVRHQGDTFRLIRGTEFSYEVTGQVLRVVWPEPIDRNITRSHFEAALRLWPVEGPRGLALALPKLQGPSYVWAILRDERIVHRSAGTRRLGQADEIREILEAIPHLSQRILADGGSYRPRLGSAHNFVTDENLVDWTFGKSVAASGEYHNDGAAARIHLQGLGFVDALDADQVTDASLRGLAIKSFRAWAARIHAIDLGQRLDRHLTGLAESPFRLLLPPVALQPNWTPSAVQEAAAKAEAFDEGFGREVTHEVRHRDRRLIALARAIHGTVCHICNFDFGKYYGPHGDGYVEMHHLHPIAEGTRESTVDDLRPVCANCHRMLHRGDRTLAVDELKRIVEEARRSETCACP